MPALNNETQPAAVRAKVVCPPLIVYLKLPSAVWLFLTYSIHLSRAESGTLIPESLAARKAII